MKLKKLPVLLQVSLLVAFTLNLLSSTAWAQVKTETKSDIQLKAVGDQAVAKKITADQYRRVVADLELLSLACADYMMDYEKAPQAQTITELLDQDAGMGPTFAQFYLDETPEELVPRKDPWGNDYLYKCDGTQYYLASAGSDGQFTDFKQSGVYLYAAEKLEGEDVVFSNGGMVYGPITEKQFEMLILLWTIFRLSL